MAGTRMSRPIVRPPVSELAFHVYTRPLHPELFETLAVRRLRRGGTTMTVRVTPTGHVLGWAHDAATLTEVTVAPDAPLPDGGRLFAHRLGTAQRGKWSGNGLRYEFSTSSEVLPPEVFVHVHEELAADGARRGLLFHFRPQHRLGLTPLGFVAVEPVPLGLSIAAFHTFPDEFTVVKTQSLFELSES
jgi:hypothetical protein